MKKTGITIWRNTRLATLDPKRSGIGLVEDGALAVRDGRILYADAESELPSTLQSSGTIDCERRWITHGLVDCHTHLVDAGNRSNESEMCLQSAIQMVAQSTHLQRGSAPFTYDAGKAEKLCVHLAKVLWRIKAAATAINLRDQKGVSQWRLIHVTTRVLFGVHAALRSAPRAGSPKRLYGC